MLCFVLQHLSIKAHSLMKLPAQDIRISKKAFRNENKPLRVLSLIERNGLLEYCNGFFHLLEAEKGRSSIEQHQPSRPMICWQECEGLARQLDGAHMLFSKLCRHRTHGCNLASEFSCHGMMCWERFPYPQDPWFDVTPGAR